MFVKGILDEKNAELITADPSDTIIQVANVFKSNRIGFALVRDSQKQLIGTISERDIIHALTEGFDLTTAKVADVLTINIVMCDVTDTLDTVRDIMTNKRTRHVLVMDCGVLAGIVSIGDLIKYSLNECQVEGVELVDYINGEGYH